MGEKETYKSEEIIHPGIILKNILQNNGMSQKELSSAIGKTTSVINDIISGKRNINVEIAVLLEAVFDSITAKDWMDYQASYDLHQTRNVPKIMEIQKSIKDWKRLEDIVNIGVLKKRTILGKSNESDMSFLYSLYNVSTFEDLYSRISKSQEVACFKKSSSYQTDHINLNTWILLTRIASTEKKIMVPFKKININLLIEKLNGVFYDNINTIQRLEEALAEFGIKFVMEKKLEKVPVDGYSFWSGNNPTIAITQRSNWLDNIAFTIFHELGHILMHLHKDCDFDFLDTETSVSSGKEKESEANDFAGKAIWGDFDYKSAFRHLAQPFAAKNKLNQLANQKRINIGIVVGQYQHFLSEINFPAAYAVCSNLKQKVQ
jgi:HTH-type transcriptional regulator/antitoxin HigA